MSDSFDEETGSRERRGVLEEEMRRLEAHLEAVVSDLLSEQVLSAMDTLIIDESDINELPTLLMCVGDDPDKHLATLHGLLSVERSSEHLSGLLATFNMAPSISVGFTEPMSALTLALLQFAFRRRQLHTSRESALGWNLPECDKDHLTAPLDAIKESTCILPGPEIVHRDEQRLWSTETQDREPDLANGQPSETPEGAHTRNQDDSGIQYADCQARASDALLALHGFIGTTHSILLLHGVACFKKYRIKTAYCRPVFTSVHSRLASAMSKLAGICGLTSKSQTTI
jgi:hypothetical protein